MRVTLKAMRVNRGMKQLEAAEKMGITLDRIKYLESEEGSAKITYQNLLEFCSLYNCTVDDISLPVNYPESEVIENE